MRERLNVMVPEHVVPMLAKLAPLPSNDDDYAFEVKWDGVRVILYSEGGRVRMESRNLLDVTPRYPELHAIGPALAPHAAVLDGEVVAFNASGVPSFQRLQARMHLADRSGVRRAMTTTPVVYMIFDVLHLDGRSTMGLPYTERRQVLEDLALDGPAWQTPSYEIGNGWALLEGTRAQGLEGLVAKRLDSVYVPGKRPGTWLKIKSKRSQELVIGGWVPGEGRRSGTIGALLIGYYDGDDLVFAGKVGTGFTDATLRMLQDRLEPLHTDTPPFTRGRAFPRDAHYVEPRLVAEVEFTEWTDANTLRHPSFKGLRDDKDPREVLREG
jgi:bifunctional non-homologous end joining protein LigD